MKILGSYKNGNTLVTIFDDGTSVKYTDDDYFDWEFPNNIDIKISDKCYTGCKYCHEGSTASGCVPDLSEIKFFDTLRPFTEVALGGGDVFLNLSIQNLLKKLYERKVIVNITVHQNQFLYNYDIIKSFYKKGYIKGIGISYVDGFKNKIDREKFFLKVNNFPTSVIHLINGIFNEIQFNYLKDRDLNAIILGYKSLRRGESYAEDNSENILYNQKWLKYNLEEVIGGFRAISFDNLALDQLNVKSKLGKEWDLLYQGVDGKESGTMYIDCVKGEFAVSSTSFPRFKLLDNVDDMYKKVKEIS